MDKQRIFSAQQNDLVIELTESYGIKPEEIMFFGDDPNPFLTYEATCALANQLADLPGIDIEPIPSVFSDSLSVKCILTNAQGYKRGAAGVVNLNETIDGKPMSEPQIYALASARAIRNALRAANIDLINLHLQKKGEVLNFKTKSSRITLLSYAHALGNEAGLIVKTSGAVNKSAWYRLLQNRYQVSSSNELTDDLLADFIAILKTLVPQQIAA